MSFVVAGCASEFEFVGDGSTALVVAGVVVIFEHVFSAAVDAGLVALFDEALLAHAWVAASFGGVDRVGMGIVD